jgi:hypothetical protein
MIGDIAERWLLTPSPDDERDPRLVEAPRPLALFVRESPLSAGSPQVLGRFLDEASGPVTTSISLRAERIGGGKVRLAWSTDLGDTIHSFSVWRFLDGRWQGVIVGVGLEHRAFEFDFGAARSFRVVAHTSYGAVFSEIATLAAARVRTVGR